MPSKCTREIQYHCCQSKLAHRYTGQRTQQQVWCGGYWSFLQRYAIPNHISQQCIANVWFAGSIGYKEGGHQPQMTTKNYNCTNITREDIMELYQNTSKMANKAVKPGVCLFSISKTQSLTLFTIQGYIFVKTQDSSNCKTMMPHALCSMYEQHGWKFVTCAIYNQHRLNPGTIKCHAGQKQHTFFKTHSYLLIFQKNKK